MKDIRLHGDAPYDIAMLHGGPGANGEMYPVALELSDQFGIIEPLQHANSVEGQIEELREQLSRVTARAVCLIGFSWGAWLAILFTARYPAMVKKLILIGCGVLEAKYAAEIDAVRMQRLSETEKNELESLISLLKKNSDKEKKELFVKFGKLFSKTDSYKQLDVDNSKMDLHPEVFESVWPEGSELRKSGRLLGVVKKIKCSMTVIHGDSDPHSGALVKQSLSSAGIKFSFFELSRCGHKPWAEKYAKEKFFDLMRKELCQ
ncbi:MAG: alpha/beta hydrolase [Lentisphaerae bacterium]|nr:alpha/beta hydrolase [Lentisphaerota bacterium]MCP4103733.1 alpha/beta hydrolase [Lentisphaerota bacterium]